MELRMQKSKELAEMVKDYFIKEIGFKNKITIAWSSDYFILNVYVNDYDYNSITIKVEDGEVSALDYISKAIYNKNIEAHKASEEEIKVINILNKYDTEDLCCIDDLCYVTKGHLLAADNWDIDINLSHIANLNYKDDVLELINYDGFKVIVDFKNNKATYEELDDNLNMKMGRLLFDLDNPEFIMKALANYFVVTNTKRLDNMVEYIGMSPFFRQLKEGGAIPTYNVITKNGKIRFVEKDENVH